MDNEIEISVKCEELYSQTYTYVTACSGCENVDDETAFIQKRTLENVYKNCFKDKSIDISLKKIDKECIKRGYFQFGEEKIKCQVLERLSRGIIRGGYVYICHAPEINQSGTILEQYYIEVWQNSFLDCVRDFLHDYLEKEESIIKKLYISGSFGPGFFGMPIDAIKPLFSVINGNKAGVALAKSGTLIPAKSLIGIYLVADENIEWQLKDCISCKGGSYGCKFCYGYKKGIEIFTS